MEERVEKVAPGDILQPSRASPFGEPGEMGRSFKAVEGILYALNPADVIRFRIDPQRAAAVAYSVAVRDLAPERRSVFVRLSEAGLYEVAVLDRLPDVAQSVWYTRQQQQVVLAEASRASVPDEEIQLAYDVRGRMQYVLEYNIGDDPRYATRLKYIREGAGHQDMANDLQLLRGLYEDDEVRAIIEQDKRRYRASDADEAKRLAGLIFTGFGLEQEGEAKRWTNLFQRSVTLLVRDYEGHREAGQFGFRRDEDVAATYPSLYAAVRSAPSRRAPEGEPGDDVDPGEPTDGEAPVEPSVAAI
jgi:hypothetical protein